MKKTITLLLVLGLGISLSAQERVPYSVSKNITKEVGKYVAITGLEDHVEQTTENNNSHSDAISAPTYNRTGELCEEGIGYSTYDLQTNNSVQNRLVEYNGKIIAAWTFSAENPPASPDRGTGYQMRDGVDWLGAPNVRIEDGRRTGWPSLMVTGGGKEIVINHPNVGFNVYTRDVVGTGAWVESMVPTNTTSDMLWPRAVSGGTDNNSIHVIGITTPEGNGGSAQMGQDGALLYFRSQDQGATWDIIDFRPDDIDETHFAGFGGDTYCIAANGNTVAYAAFNGYEGDSFVMISNDNGTTWTRRTFLDLPLDNWVFDESITDVDGDGIADTLISTDRSGNVHVDSNGKVHITYGTFRFYDDEAGDALYTTFPGLSGIYYWNNDMADDAPVLIHTLPEDYVGTTDFPDYRANPTGMTNMATDPSDPNKMALAFSGVVSDLVYQDTYNFRQIFVMKSLDGGSTWTDAINVTPLDLEEETVEQECIYPSVIPQIMDNKLSLMFHKDSQPGVILRQDNDSPGDVTSDDNFVRFLEVDLDYVVSGIEDNEVIKNSISIYPNPSSNGVFQMEKLNNLEYIKYSVIDLLGKTVYSSEFNNNNNIETIDLSSIKSGMYLLKAETTTDSFSQSIIIE